MHKFEKGTMPEKSPDYHNTWRLLQKYRDISWSMELSVQEVRREFSIEYGSSVEEFLDSIYLAGADLSGTEIEHHAKCIKRSHQMLALLDSAVELLRSKHKNGEAYYWVLYFSFLSPHRLHNVDEIMDQLRPHIQDISYRTYYRKRREAIEALGAVLWGYSARDCLDLLEHFFWRTVFIDGLLTLPSPTEKSRPLSLAGRGAFFSINTLQFPINAGINVR